MTHLIDGARQILAEHDETAVAHGFTERLEVAARGGSDGPAPRTIAAPYYLTDLGVRRFDDPALFYRAHAERFGWTETISVAGTHELMLDVPVEDLAGLLDAVVLVLGDYETAVDVVRRRYGSIEASTDFDLQIYSGVLLAAHGDESCRPLFAAASEQPHVGAVHRFMAHHRLAAAEIKRFRQPDRGIAIVDEIDVSMSAAADCGEISEGDRAAMASVTANLRALGLLGTGDATAARVEVERARSVATVEGLSKVGRGESARYAAQESINIAQLLSAGENGESSVAVLTSNVSFCREFCPEYLGEALSALAYAQFLAEDHDGAIDTARDAIRSVVREASPVRLRAVREILIGALASSSRLTEAEHELGLLDDDPLGLAPEHAQSSRPRTTRGQA